MVAASTNFCPIFVLLCFQVLPLELHIALEIYVVPFSNAKVVGSFRMARLNMFRRKVVA
jgi:hypothetical protein